MAYDKNDTKDIQHAYKYEYCSEYREDWDVHRNYIENFDAYEAMVLGQVYDSVSRSIDGSKITDSYATTLAKERADRVIAKLPDGETQPMGRGDMGKAAFMDILRQKWLYPNANAQHPFLEKLNMWQFYSSVYGYMPMFYDWNVSATGYTGPDCWLWNPRNLVPQRGRISIQDMDYVTALTWVSKDFLQRVRDKKTDNDSLEDGWDSDALDLLIQFAGQEKTDIDQERDTKTTRDRTPYMSKKGVCLATRYEAGEDGNWVTFAPDHADVQVRKLKNPHKNGRIPFVIKYSQPLFDSFYGLGDFQRAKPLQFARDGLTNFYFKGIKMNLIPPIVANANGVVKHTLDYREGGVMLETIPNSIRQFQTSNAGLSTYQAAQSSLTGSLLSLYGTQNASIPGADALNPSQGKTPGAIDMYTQKEATRDGAERRHLEAAIEQLTDGFNSLIVAIGTETIPVNLFADDVKEIVKSGLTDVKELFKNFRLDENGMVGELKIDLAALKDVEFRFNIATDSTMQEDREKQLEALERIMGTIGKFQNQLKDDPRIEVNWPAMLSAYEAASGVKGSSEFVIVKDAPSPQEQAVMDENKQLQQQVAEMQQQLQEAQAQQQAPPAEEPQQPTIAQSGHMFDDPQLADVANAIHGM